ncbi:MAG: glutathione S-transferase family protein [Bradyrhizobiaceae bacterium]|nr:glutathione S-transferase family protein [Bradyrhizobiaceae bacterium]
MALTLYFHPLASFCWKPLIALYENATPFTPVIVDLMDPQSAAAFKAVWPMAKFPVLRDEARGCTVAESTVVIEYLDAFYPGATRLIPKDPDAAWRARMWDRFHDEYLQKPMQKIVTDRLRPEDRRDPLGVEEARAQLIEAYALLEMEMAAKRWAVGDEFTLADCSAAPALFYANTVEPLGGRKSLSAYLDRLMDRASFARVLAEAEPYFSMFPLERKPERVRAAGGSG